MKNGNTIKARVLLAITAHASATTPEMIFPAVDGAKLSTIRSACFNLLDERKVSAISVKVAGRKRSQAAFYVRTEQIEGMACKVLHRPVHQFGWVGRLKAWWRKRRKAKVAHATNTSA
jgi:hypothetical protein